MKGLYYKSLQLQKVCKEHQKMAYFKENYIKKRGNNYGKYSGNYCINQFLRYILLKRNIH